MAALMTRCRSLRTELDRLDDAIGLLDRPERAGLDKLATAMRDCVDTFEEAVAARSASRDAWRRFGRRTLDKGVSRTYVRAMGLVWRQRSLDRWVGFDDDGQQVGHVALVITAGGERHYWHGWRRDSTPDGIDLGAFPTAEQARGAVDEAGSTPT